MSLTRLSSVGLLVVVLGIAGCGGGSGENTVDTTPTVPMSEDDPNYHGPQNNG